jgi:hypothetical protein
MPQAAMIRGWQHRRLGGTQGLCWASQSIRGRCLGFSQRLSDQAATTHDAEPDRQSRSDENREQTLVPDGAISVGFNAGRRWLPLASKGARALALMLAMSMLVLTESIDVSYCLVLCNLIYSYVVGCTIFLVKSLNARQPEATRDSKTR